MSFTMLLDTVTPLAKRRARERGLKIVFLGAGVIGGSVGGWVAPHYDGLYFLDVGETARALRERGITVFPGAKPTERTNVRVKVIDDLADVPDADVVILGVKNYSLGAVAQAVRDKLGDKPLVVGMQNGVENQSILPKYFSRVAYCVISYNAWAEAPGVIGYQKRGPLILGTLDNSLGAELRDLARVLNLGVPTILTHHLADAAHSKLVINLTNSLTTLLGLGYRDIPDRALFQKLLANLTWEGVRIVKAAGYKECKLGGMPTWKELWAGAHLPRAITAPIFEKNVAKMVLSSMAQDVIQRGQGQSELETINGYLLSLADAHGVPAPYNRAVYALCTDAFAKRPFEPLAATDIWSEVQRHMAETAS